MLLAVIRRFANHYVQTNQNCFPISRRQTHA